VVDQSAILFAAYLQFTPAWNSVMLRRIAAVVLASIFMASSALAENWPGWRGPRGDGTVSEKGIAQKWNGESGENILWKSPLPGTGHSSPVVWDDAVFVTACLLEDQSRVLMRVDANSGKLVWQQTIFTAPLEKRHKLNSYSSGTPATDGRLIYVTFLEPDFGSTSQVTPGNLVIAAYDFAGQQKWLVKPGRFSSTHGFCSSPVLFENKVIVNGDHDGDGYIVALDRETGEKVWRVERPNNTRSYVTPLIREIDGRTQMVLSGSKCVTSYDPRTGKELWYMDGPTEQFVASLVYNGTYFFLTAGFPEHHILALRTDGMGTLDEDHIVWRTTRNCSYVPSPVICGDYFLVVADNGIATCYEANTGKQQWVSRLAAMNHSASLLTMDGVVLFIADDGITRVVRPGPEFELVSENPLGEDCYASPAVSNGRLFLRGSKHLFCIGTASK
jgi:outer membrane protein assembly factor BamB